MKLSHLLTALVLLAGPALAGCRSSGASGLQEPCDQIDLEQAEQLVHEWVYEEFDPDLSPGATFPLEELTTDRIWRKLNSQVYTSKSNVTGMGSRPLLIECEEVFDLGRYRGLGGQAVDELRVTDLDADDHYELVFLDTWGSSMVRTAIVAYVDLSDPLLLQADKAFEMNVDFERVSDQELYIVKHTQEGVDEPIIGRVLLETDGLVPALTIELVDGLPADVLDRIWFDYGI